MSSLFLLSYIAVWVMLLFQSLILVGLVRTVHQLQRGATLGVDVQSLRGREAPSFVAEDLAGVQVSSAAFEDQLRAFVFISPDCRSCSLTLAEMDALHWKAEGTVIVICRAGKDACRELVEKYNLETAVLVDEHNHVGDVFGISSVPAAVLVGEDNRIKVFGEPMRVEELEEILHGADESELTEAK